MQNLLDEIILVPSWTRRDAISVISRKSEIWSEILITLTYKSG